MKVAVIADTHWGVRNDNPVLRAAQAKYHRDAIVPEILARGVERVVHLGDLFDRRKYVNFVTAEECKRSFIEPITQSGIPITVIVGNHDSYYKNTIRQNSPRTVFGGTPLVGIVDRPGIGSDGVLYLPWICDDNREACEAAIRGSGARHVMAHLELTGFTMHGGELCRDGMSADAFGAYDTVLSGHFHARSQRGNVRYVGATGQYSWGDVNDVHGFCFFDTETGEVEYVDNAEDTFRRVALRGDETEDEVAEMAAGAVGKFCKVVHGGSPRTLLASVIDAMEGAGAADVQVVSEEFASADASTVHAAPDIDTLGTLIATLSTRVPPERLAIVEAKVREMYAEAVDNL